MKEQRCRAAVFADTYTFRRLIECATRGEDRSYEGQRD